MNKHHHPYTYKARIQLGARVVIMRSPMGNSQIDTCITYAIAGGSRYVKCDNATFRRD